MSNLPINRMHVYKDSAGNIWAASSEKDLLDSDYSGDCYPPVTEMTDSEMAAFKIDCTSPDIDQDEDDFIPTIMTLSEFMLMEVYGHEDVFCIVNKEASHE